MPISYRVNHRQQRISATAAGVLELADFAAYIASRVRDGVYDYDQLVDLSHAQLRATAADVVKLVNDARVHLSARPLPLTAVVATPNSSTFGVVQELSTLFGFEGAFIHVVDSSDKASEWLDRMRAAAPRGSEPATDST